MTDASPSWVQRHWKWLIPAGCLGLLLAAVVWAAFIGSIVLAGMKSSGVYQDAVTAVERSPRAAEALGSPVEIGWWVMGSINVSGPSGEADLAIPVSGPDAVGRLYVVGEKRAGLWTLELLELEVEDRGERVDLLADE